MNDSRITLAVLVAATFLAAVNKLDGDTWLALVGGSLLRSPLPVIRGVVRR